jgi:HPt (histidine-containing phosphotransfer) domain-containing protein
MSMDPRDKPDYEIDHLLAVVEQDDELARLVAAQFLALGDSLPERLHAALAACEATAAARVAHEIKGMAAMLGAERLAAAASAVESGAVTAPPLAALQEEWRRVGRRLTDYVEASV